MKDKFSLIKWNEDLNMAPTGQDLFIIYRDDSGDHINYNILVAWHVYSNPEIWISDNDQICRSNIIAWAKFPEYDSIIVS